MTNTYKHFHRIAWAGVLLTLCVIVLGGFVRLSHAGLSCPDWPTCYGRATWPVQDHEVAAANAVFVMAYSNVGLSPDGGATWSLVRALPRATALQLLMGGERIGPDRLEQLGVINAVCGNGEALDQALALAERLNARAPNALASIKDLVNDAAGASLHAQLAAERDHFVRNLHHPNAGEGIAAFMDKRPASYR